MTGFKFILTLAVLALFSITITPTAKAHDGPLATTVQTVTNIAVAPIRIAAQVRPVARIAQARPLARVVNLRPRLLDRTARVTVPIVTTDTCGQITSVGTTTACVEAVLFPRLKARRLANGYAVNAQSSSVQTVLVQ